MSYILNALKKAEQERDIGRVPRLESVQDVPPPRSRAIPWLIAGALLVNAVVLAFWLRPPAKPDVQTPPPRVATPAPAAKPAAVQAPVAAPVPPAVPQVAAPEEISAPEPLQQSPAPVPLRPEVVPPAPPEPVAAAAPSNPAEPEPAAPLLRDLPEGQRAALPSLSLDVHVYAPEPANRFVLIKMKKYHEGEQLADGPRLEEITREGVVLSYQGERFRILRP